MRAGPDHEVVRRVNGLRTSSWSGIAFRHTARGRDPLSGTGALLNGGRWNPAGACSAVYLAQPMQTAVREFERLAEANQLEPLVMLRRPRELHTIVGTDLKVLDLCVDGALTAVGLTVDDISDNDWTACQNVGHAGYLRQLQGLLAPSAAGTGLVIAVFDAHIEPGQLKVQATEVFDEAKYRRITGL